MITVTPPDKVRQLQPRISVSYDFQRGEGRQKVIAEVNPNMPFTLAIRAARVGRSTTSPGPSGRSSRLPAGG